MIPAPRIDAAAAFPGLPGSGWFAPRRCVRPTPWWWPLSVVFVLCLLAALLQPAQAAAPVTLHGDVDNIRLLGSNLDLLADPESRYTLDRIVAGDAESAFFSGNQTVPVFQGIQGTYWARLRLHNPTPKTIAATLVVEFANFRRMVFYAPEGNAYRARTIDTSLHVRETDHTYRYPAYALRIAPGETATYFLSISSHSARFPLRIWNSEALERFALHEFGLQGLLFGIVLCALGYQIALTLLAKEAEHWSLALCIVNTLLIILCMLGYQHVYFGRFGDWLTHAYSTLLITLAVSIVLFSRHFLSLREKLPRLDQVLRIVQSICLAIALVSLADPRIASATFPYVLVIGVTLLLTAMGILGWRRDALAGLYLISVMPIIATGALATLINAGAFPIPDHYHTMVAGGFVLGIMMFSFSSAHRIGQQRKERQAMALAAQQAEHRTRIQTEFLANMSHEVRTPLNAVIGMLDLMRRETDDPVQQHRIDVATRSSDVLLAIFNQVLDFAQMESEPIPVLPENFSVATVLGEVLELVSEEAQRKGIALTTMLAPSLPPVLHGDAKKIRQLALNLLANAVKFTDRGQVILRAHTTPCSGGEVILRIEVADTGIGIAPAAQARIFERFVQADDSIRTRYGGTGLGLYICRELVQVLGGKIGVISSEGAGSTFWFEIPLAPGKEIPQGELQPAMASRRSALRLLVVEDNEINQELVHAMLRHEGHQVTLAADGAQALARLAEQNFDAILMDVGMPVMDGVEATRRIRSLPDLRKRATPIIGLTAHAVAQKLASFIEAGMDDVLTKPVRIGDLQMALDGVQRRQLADEAALLDEDIIHSHLHLLGKAKLQSLLYRQFAEARHSVGQMRAGLVSAAPEELGRIAHRVVGSFAFLGLAGAADPARKIEAACETGGTDGLAPLLDEQEEAIAVAERLLAAFLDRFPAQASVERQECEAAPVQQPL